MSEAKRQHFVPRFYLERFTGENGKLWVLDKQRDEVFSQKPSRLAAKRWFYHRPGQPQFLERRLSALEGAASKIFTHVDENRPIISDEISFQDQEWIDLYLAVQMLRDERARIRHDQFISSLKGEFGERAVPKLKKEMEKTTPRDIQTLSLLNATTLTDSIGKLRHMLMINETTLPYTTSDSPVALDNRHPNPNPHGGNLGLESKGIEIYLPLSPELSLCTFDTSIFPRSRSPVHATERNESTVEYARWLQVHNSVRHVFSSTKDFDIERQILDEVPELRNPYRPQTQSRYGGKDLVREHYQGPSKNIHASLLDEDQSEEE